MQLESTRVAHGSNQPLQPLRHGLSGKNSQGISFRNQNVDESQ